MTQNRFYSSTAAKAALQSPITSGATSMVVNTTVGWPVSYPFTLILERDTANEEVVTCTSAPSGSAPNITVPITRGVDTTGAISHSAGAVVEHGVSARDFNEPQVHIAASSGVHGLTGAVVGTTDTQTLSAKTLTQPTIADFTNAAHAHAGTTSGGLIGPATLTWTPTIGGTGWSLGTGTITARYVQVGKWVFYNLALIGTFNAGTGPLTFSLPLNGNASNPVLSQIGAGQWQGHIATGSLYALLRPGIDNTVMATSLSNQLGTTDSNSFVVLTGHYESV